MEDLGGAVSHATKSGVCHFAADGEEECLAMVRDLLQLHPAEQPRRAAARADLRPRDRQAAELATIIPDQPVEALRHPPGHRAGRRRRGLPRGRAALRPEPGRRLRAPGRPRGRDRRQPAQGARRRARHRRLHQGRALHPLLRRLQHPAGLVRGRARASCRAPARSLAGSSSTARSSSTPTPRRRCPSSP